MPQRQLEATLAQELGDNWREEVAEFEDVPVAAASIGQVGAPMDATRTHGPIGGRWVRTHSRQTPLSWQVHPFAADTPFMAGAPIRGRHPFYGRCTALCCTTGGGLPSRSSIRELQTRLRRISGA